MIYVGYYPDLKSFNIFEGSICSNKHHFHLSTSTSLTLILKIDIQFQYSLARHSMQDKFLKTSSSVKSKYGKTLLKCEWGLCLLISALTCFKLLYLSWWVGVDLTLQVESFKHKWIVCFTLQISLKATAHIEILN